MTPPDELSTAPELSVRSRPDAAVTVAATVNDSTGSVVDVR